MRGLRTSRTASTSRSVRLLSSAGWGRWYSSMRRWISSARFHQSSPLIGGFFFGGSVGAGLGGSGVGSGGGGSLNGSNGGLVGGGAGVLEIVAVISTRRFFSSLTLSLVGM